ncbi:hypothetical protein CN234_17395 [Sinorhizobium meliloti]|uniref:hypothetical protein n=1 Tax=Rhizobium meliloti TaxID=382 RepID=UPI000FD43077|nr:hypothetical protein [Sinorhizobium meliloti]RVG08557.1 hypothetical protein CN234_17395 [Sinorhizobium meliloti]RVL48470.1 hypothetical protein CN145_23190 [Sinorhizobium meliloti]
MSDIVDRLLSLSNCDARAGEPLGKCMREAAIDIKILRDALEDCIDALKYGSDYPEANWVILKAQQALGKK